MNSGHKPADQGKYRRHFAVLDNCPLLVMASMDTVKLERNIYLQTFGK